MQKHSSSVHQNAPHGRKQGVIFFPAHHGFLSLVPSLLKYYPEKNKPQGQS